MRLISNDYIHRKFKKGVAAYRRGDYSAAFREFKTLAEQGDASAQYNIGLMYAKRQAVPKNYREAAKWYRKAAVQGEASAQLNLGAMYSKGRGVHRNCKLAYMWYSLSAARGDNMAARNIDVIEKRMTRAQVVKAQAMAAKKAQAMAAKCEPRKAKPTKWLGGLNADTRPRR